MRRAVRASGGAPGLAVALATSMAALVSETSGDALRCQEEDTAGASWSRRWDMALHRRFHPCPLAWSAWRGRAQAVSRRKPGQAVRPAGVCRRDDGPAPLNLPDGVTPEALLAAQAQQKYLSRARGGGAAVRESVAQAGHRSLSAHSCRVTARVAQGTLRPMKLAIDLSPAQADRLQERAKNLGLQPEELARAAVADLLTTPDDEFRAAAEAVLQKNAELYRRLA